MSDLAVLAMDPRFGGGGRALTEAFWRAAVSLGREPELHYVAHPSLIAEPLGETPLRASGLKAPFRRFDAGNQIVGGRRLSARVRGARSVWVVAATAPCGYAARRSGRPYACWLATGLRDEWASRRGGLPRSRRLALRVNAPILLPLERAVLRGAKRLYGISASSARSVARAAGLDEDRVGVLPIPVDLERFRPAPDGEWQAGLERPLLVFVGRGDDPRKNARLLLESFPLVRAGVPGARLRFVGGPPPGPVPEGVETTGFVASVAEQVREAALLVLPSLQEGFGIVAAEALASGVPVLTTPSGGPEQLVRDSGGGVVLGGFSADELAAKASELLGDAARLRTMRASGREYVAREHSPDKLRAQLAQAFRELDG
jgi:glycosyltransferase involved in cell wall biosynthesis